MPIDRTPTAADRAILRAMLRPGRDADLPVAERSTRTRVSVAVDYAASTTIEFDGKIVEVLGPGRGDGWIYCAWRGDYGPVLGSVYADQVGPPKVEEGP